ncbi:MAG TPA: peptide ABC transporter substrate-binding protein [Thermoleophilia bacterium]|nr:peptide ABC transporter substrate-binding protein [Thermoleophilia bacterium]
MNRLVPRTRLVVAAVVLALVAGLVWGLAGAVADSSSPSPAGAPLTLRVGWITEPDNLNPFVGYETSSYEIWNLNYSWLFLYDLHGNVACDLATEIPTQQNGGVSADGKVWTIHIRPKVTWQDGQPLTAEDVAWTLNYIIDNQMYAYAIGTLNMKHAVALDPTTVRITCSKPKADMLRAYWPVLPKHIWQHISPKAAGTSYEMTYPIVGSGPFQTVQFKKGAYVKMVANPHYYGPRPAIQQILFETYTDANSMEADLLNGTIDAAQGVPEAQFANLKTKSGFKAIAYNYFNWDYMDFNCYTGKSTGNPVLLDPAFRHAINYAIDNRKLANLAWQGYAEPGSTIMTPHSWTDPDYHWQPPADQLYTFDLAKAQGLLAGAGYRKAGGKLLDKKGKPITLRLYTDSGWPQLLSEAKLVAGWLEQLGIKVNLQAMDGGALSAKLYNYAGNVPDPDFDLAIWQWDGYLDPGQTLASYSTDQIGGWNEPEWSNAEFDRLNIAQETTLDPNARKELVWKMQQIMYDQTPIVVFTYYDYLQAVNTSRWDGWKQTLNGRGPAFYCSGSNIDSYLYLRPKAASSSGGGGTALIVAAVIAVVIVLGLVGYLLRRRRPQALETADA